MKKTFLIVAFVLSTAFHAQAQELQLPGTEYSAAIGTFGAVNGGDDSLIFPNVQTSNRTVGANVDGPGIFGGTNQDNIGQVPDGSGFALTINGSEVFTDLGNGDFEFTVTLRSAALTFDGSGQGISAGDLAPAISDDEERSSLVLVLGESLGPGNGPSGTEPANLQTNEHFLTAATLEAFDLQGGITELRGQVDLDLVNNAAFADTNGDGGPEFNGFGEFELDGVIGDIGLVRLTLIGTLGPAPSVLLGDVDQNGIVNFLDISPFIGLLSAGGFQEEADIDGNGLVNFLDISPFIGILAGA